MGTLAVPGGKNQVSQSGIRVPLIANWPARIRPGLNTDIVDASDFLPTVADLGGSGVPDDWGSDGLSFAPRLFGKAGTPREWAFFWYDPRPGWDKDRFTRHIFALDRAYKLFSDGRMYAISGDLPTEQALDLSRLSPEAVTARDRLRKVIEQMMQPPLCAAALMDPDAFGKP
jgi:arylsulfatase A-like enzyme